MSLAKAILDLIRAEGGDKCPLCGHTIDKGLKDATTSYSFGYGDNSTQTVRIAECGGQQVFQDGEDDQPPLKPVKRLPKNQRNKPKNNLEMDDAAMEELIALNMKGVMR